MSDVLPVKGIELRNVAKLWLVPDKTAGISDYCLFRNIYCWSTTEMSFLLF